MMAESLRLLYVALTRARHRCYLPWGSVKGSEDSALAWLLHSEAASDDSPGKTGLETLDRLDPNDLNTELEELVAASAGSIAWEPMPVDTVPPQRELSMPPQLGSARHFAGSIPSQQRIASFSSIVSGHSEDLPDYDVQSERHGSSARASH